jgi:hypothetical protein
LVSKDLILIKEPVVLMKNQMAKLLKLSSIIENLVIKSVKQLRLICIASGFHRVSPLRRRKLRFKELFFFKGRTR